MSALRVSRAGHTVQFVAALDCTEPRAMFVLHCIVHNIAGNVEAQLEAVGAMMAASTVNDGVRARIATFESVASCRAVAGSAGREDTPKWTLDDVPDAVRKGVADADERQLRLVPGLSAVRRVPEPVRELLHDDGIIIGCSKVGGRGGGGARATVPRRCCVCCTADSHACCCASSRCRCDAGTRPSGAARVRS